MKLDSYTDRELLEMYAPVLRFSGGENFYPMNVEDYVAGKTRLFQKNKKGKHVLSKEWEQMTEPAERLEMLGRIKEKRTIKDGKSYLQFIVRDFRLDVLPRALLTIIVTALVVVIIFGMIWLGGRYPLLDIDYADIVKMCLLGFFIVTWPFVDADGKAHLGLLLNLFGIFFFGTILTIGFGMLSIGILAGFWVAYFVFRIGLAGPHRIRNSRLLWLHGLNLLLIAFSSGIVGFAISWIGVNREWFTAGPFDAPAITTFSTILFYAFLVFGDAAEPKNPKDTKDPKANRPKEYKYISFLFAVLLMVAGVLWFGLARGLVSDAIACVAAVSLSGVSLLWYVLDPLSVVKPGLLLEENQAPSKFGWDGRVLAFITGAFLVYILFSALVYFFDYREVSDIIFAVLLHFLVSAFGLFVTVGILGERVISYFLDILSGLYNTDALKAWRKVQPLIVKRLASAQPGRNKRYWYYGRVCREDDWTILQYNYFYAFNDYRSTAGGMNNHEGDWECVHIFVRGDGEECSCTGRPHIKPFGVAYSQHYDGALHFWENVAKAKNGNSEETCHALVYVALGSHANFARPEIYPLSRQIPGAAQRIAAVVEKFIEAFRSRSRLTEAYDRMWEASVKSISETKHRLVARGGGTGGLQEYACGDGIRVGYGFNADWAIYRDEFIPVYDRPSGILRRESNFDGKPADPKIDFFDDWAFDVITEETDWVKFKGLWGRLSGVEGESGPQGPRWNGNDVRVRWGGRGRELSGRGKEDYFLEWLDVLLLDIVEDANRPTMLRKQALVELTRGNRQEVK